MKKDKVWEDILMHWSVIIDRFSHNYDINRLRLRTRQGKDMLPILEIIEKQNRNKKEYLEVKFENGEIISSKEHGQNDNDVLVEVIIRANIEKVQKLELTTQGGIPIVVDDVDSIEKDGYIKVGSKLIFAKTGIDFKKSLIEKILKRRKLNAIVNIKTK